MRKEIDRITVRDSEIILWRVDVPEDSGRPVMHRLCAAMRQRGWTIGVHPETHKNYRCLSKGTRYGFRKGLEVLFWATGRCIEIEFFQNVCRPPGCNPNGGRYDSNKLRDMPYLLRLRTQYEMRLLIESAKKEGYHYKPERVAESSIEQVFLHRKSWTESHGNMYTGDSHLRCQNGIDADGNQLEDACYRTCYDYTGHLFTGQVWYHANNMWFICSGGDYLNVGSHDLFKYDSAKHPRRQDRSPERSRKDHLRKMIQSGQLRRAAELHDAMKRAGESCTIEANVAG